MQAEQTLSSEITIPLESALLSGELIVPAGAPGVVLFAHGSGSSRHSPRNKFVAGEIREKILGTLLFDLLTPEEEEIDARTRHLRFDIELLARRLVAASNWLTAMPAFESKKIGFFGSSTGGAAAIVAAAALGEQVGAVVSRGGRPDLAGAALGKVKSPVLLLVGGRDETVLELNKQAFARMRCEKELKIIPGATHLFEEPGKLELVALFAAEWFARFLK
jgi:dienelactone hydrolase